MFRKNIEHEQGVLFSLENDMHPRIKKRLENHWSGLFYEKIFTAINEDSFSMLYSDEFGRDNFPVNILIGLDILKEMFHLTDEQTFERYHFDYGFRRALGMKDFHGYPLAERTLYNFRSAVAEYEFVNNTSIIMPIFKDIRDDVIKELGIRTNIQRTDSTMISANIKRMTRLMLFHKVLSNLVRDMAALGIELDGAIVDILSKNEDAFAYHLKREEVLEKTKEIGGYIYRIVSEYAIDAKVDGLKSYQNAKRLLNEQCKTGEDKTIDLNESKEISSSSMQNPADPDATYRKKNNTACQGYALHATETCSPENKIQLVMDVELTANNVDDAAVLAGKIGEYKKESGLEVIIGDGGFVSNDVREECDEHDVMFVATAIRGASSKDNDAEMLTSCDFVCDSDTGAVISCPAGNVPQKIKVEDNKSTATFDRNLCINCDKNHICPAYTSGKKSRIVVDVNRRWLDERKRLLSSGEYLKLCGLRPAVEGLMSQLKPKYLKGRTLFIGKAKVKNRMILKAIGINFRRVRAFSLEYFLCFCRELLSAAIKWYYLDRLHKFA